MANTYSQLFVHFVFAVRNRSSIINDNWQGLLYKYIAGIIEKQGHKLFSINGMPDHIHILVSMKTTQSPSDLVYHIKRSSSLWINENKFEKGKFSWQEGFGAFSYGKSQVPAIAKYIENQKEHHKKKSFEEEYMGFLKAFDIEFDKRFTFKPIE